MTGEYKVVFFGILDYKVLSSHRTEAVALRELAKHQARARAGGYAVAGFTRNAVEHDFDVRTQDDLDALVRAIQESYR